MSSAHRGYCRAEGAERPGGAGAGREQLEKSGKPFREADVLQRAYDNAMRQYGTGSDLQKAAQAVTGRWRRWRATTAGALASGASPYGDGN